MSKIDIPHRCRDCQFYLIDEDRSEAWCNLLDKIINVKHGELKPIECKIKFVTWEDFDEIEEKSE